MADAPTHIEAAYGSLLRAFADAKRMNKPAWASEIWAAIEVFEKLWPLDCERWQKRFPRSPEEDTR